MNPTLRAYLQIHTAVILFGFTGILGDLIDLPKPTLVWWRMGLACIGLLALPLFTRGKGFVQKSRNIPAKRKLTMFGIGGIIAVHWITFFGGIALTNVSVALACMATASFFTAILEPLIIGRKFKWYELALGIVVVPGVMLIYRSTDFEFWGILVSLISAFLAALFSILNKKYVTEYDTTAVTFVELGSGWVILSLFLPFFYHFSEPMAFLPQGWDLLWLSLLAFACTSFAFVISLAALRVLSTFVTNLTINLEPVYTIILAFFLFAEHKELDILFYPGAGIIILAVFAHPFLDKRFG